jgi:F0F1-type ATP synthase gamma subunit
MAGRPTEYNQTFVQNANAYIEMCEDAVEQIVSGQSEKGFTAFTTKVTVKLPTIEGLANYLGIHKDTVYDWENKYPEFSDVINVLRNKQVERLINNGLSGDYNSNIAKLLLAKHGYADKQEVNNIVKAEVNGGIVLNWPEGN